MPREESLKLEIKELAKLRRSEKPCWQHHPGFCAHQGAGVIQRCKRLAKMLHNQTEQMEPQLGGLQSSARELHVPVSLTLSLHLSVVTVL